MLRNKDPRYFLLGTVPTADDKDIKTSKAPTHKQYLLSFLARKDACKDKSGKYLSTTAVATVSDKKLVNHYEKLDCSLKNTQTRADEVLALYGEMLNIMKYSKQRRESDSNVKKKIEDFKRKLEKTMVVWSKNSVADEEDQRFLANMETDRTFSVAGRDTKLQEKVKSKQQRQLDEQRRKEKEKERLESVVVLDEEQLFASSSSGDVPSEGIQPRFPVRLYSFSYFRQTHSSMHLHPAITREAPVVGCLWPSHG